MGLSINLYVAMSEQKFDQAQDFLYLAGQKLGLDVLQLDFFSKDDGRVVGQELLINSPCGGPETFGWNKYNLWHRGRDYETQYVGTPKYNPDGVSDPELLPPYTKTSAVDPNIIVDFTGAKTQYGIMEGKVLFHAMLAILLREIQIQFDPEVFYISDEADYVRTGKLIHIAEGIEDTAKVIGMIGGGDLEDEARKGAKGIGRGDEYIALEIIATCEDALREMGIEPRPFSWSSGLLPSEGREIKAQWYRHKGEGDGDGETAYSLIGRWPGHEVMAYLEKYHPLVGDRESYEIVQQVPEIGDYGEWVRKAKTPPGVHNIEHHRIWLEETLVPKALKLAQEKWGDQYKRGPGQKMPAEKEYKTPDIVWPTTLSASRAKIILKDAVDAPGHGPWQDRIKEFMTKDEEDAVMQVWDQLPGETSFTDALEFIAENSR